MKYMITVSTFMEVESRSVTVTSDDVNFTGFPATIGNPNYDAFLVDAQLTDEEVHALKPDTWFDFPKASK